MKVWAYVALVTALLAGGRWAYVAIYDAGFNDAKIQQDQAIREAQDAAVLKARAQWEATAEIAEANIVVEERIVEVVRTVEKEIPKIVERIVEVRPDCADLGDDFAGLLNAQIRAGSGGPPGGPDPAPVPD